MRPLAGRFAELLFTLGMIGTGMLAVPVLAGSSAYVAAQTFRFREGLSEPVHRAPRFYSIIAAGVLIGIGMNLLHIDAIKALVLVGGSQWRRSGAVAGRDRLACIRSPSDEGVDQFSIGSDVGMGDVRADGRSDRRYVLFHGARRVGMLGTALP